MDKERPTFLDILSWISITIIVSCGLGLMAYHTPAILSLTTFWLGFWWRGVE